LNTKREQIDKEDFIEPFLFFKRKKVMNIFFRQEINFKKKKREIFDTPLYYFL